MTDSKPFQIMARTMRPQTFADVVGQEKVKVTLKNAFQLNRLGHAYLFSGFHGIGKTTLARLFAKLLNCDHPVNGEPCNQCSSCKEIAAANSLDVIEIDGASNRGIDDIRQINESVGFAVKGGKHKIYILDEVHMLTKEAFNALLKTLEAPPSHVKFLFATTEPHKIPSTILSRCQCFELEPIKQQEIADHIVKCADAQGVQYDAKAATLTAQRAHGSLRDALVLADQLISYSMQEVTYDKASHFLGLLPKSQLFDFDQKAKQKDIAAAFQLTESVIGSGKNIAHFLELLCEHYRQILYIKIYNGNPELLKVSESEWPNYEASAQCYQYEQCLHIIDLILEAQATIKYATSKKIALENLLIQIIRSSDRVSIKSLMEKLEGLKNTPMKEPAAQKPKVLEKPASPSTPPKKAVEPRQKPEKPTKIKEDTTIKETSKKELTTPSSPSSTVVKPGAEKQNICYNTVMQFAAVELEGSFKKEG